MAGRIQDSGAHGGLDFTAHLRQLCADIVSRLDELAHIQLDRVAIRVCQTRKRGAYGTYASLTPLRFADGKTTQARANGCWRIEPLFREGREMLYLLSFYLPRFCDQHLEEKLATVVHELWHIGPDFDGDLRRFPGRCYAHGASETEFHRHMRVLAREWLDQSPDPELYAFLRHEFAMLRRLYGRVYGERIATPKLVRIAKAAG